MRQHKWGIFFLFLLAWNSEGLGRGFSQGRYWGALASGVVAVLCGVMAYLYLTKRPTRCGSWES